MSICAHCGKEFSGRPNWGRKFCSSSCYHTHDNGTERVERVSFSCGVCGTEFRRAPGELAAYRKKWGQDPKYCSRSCGGKGRMLSDAKWQVDCMQCGTPMPIQRKPGGQVNRQRKLCSTECRKAYKLAEHERLRPAEDRETQRSITRQGYVRLRFPNMYGTKGREVLEHRLAMEQHIGRELLPEETVHHVNGVRDDNRLENLELFSSRHGPGQRVIDKVEFAISILRLYPEFAAEAGVVLADAEHQNLPLKLSAT